VKEMKNCIAIWKECLLRDQATDGIYIQLMIERLDCSELIQGRVLKQAFVNWAQKTLASMQNVNLFISCATISCASAFSWLLHQFI
jgi:hypothetical protein